MYERAKPRKLLNKRHFQVYIIIETFKVTSHTPKNMT